MKKLLQRLGTACAALALGCTGAAAQFARTNPFSIGVNEGSVGEVGRVGLWLLQEQARFYQALRLAVEAAQANPAAALSLAAVSFAYGVFHAAGPGHGKAVIASYMLANEKALRRGIVLSALSALLQAVVAIAIVGVAALVLGATAQKMTAATHVVEVASYVCITALGLWLVWRKGGNFVAALRAPPLAVASRFRCDDGTHAPDCAHCVAPDPSRLGEGFSWRQGVATVVAAGSAALLRGAAGACLRGGAGRVHDRRLGGVRDGGGHGPDHGGAGRQRRFREGRGDQNARRRPAPGRSFSRLLEVAAACVVLGLGASLLAGLVVTGGAG